MPSRLGVIVPLAVVVAGLAAGCAASEPAPPGTAPASAPTAEVAEPATPRGGLSAARELNLEQANDEGVSVRLVRAQFEANRIVVDLVVRNGSRNPVALASSPYTGMTLVDDTGASYNFVVPERNKALRVGPGRTYEGQVVFSGALSPEARALTLVTNAGADGDRYVPRFEFAAIPVQ